MKDTDIFKLYLDRPTDAQEDFDEVARQVPSSALEGGLADAVRSDKTLTSVAGGSLGGMFQGSAGVGGGVPDATQISASVLAQLTPDQVRELATEAQRYDRVLDRVVAFDADHREVVKILGGAALAIALSQVATRRRR